jgi:hypothetical protein
MVDVHGVLGIPFGRDLPALQFELRLAGQELA